MYVATANVIVYVTRNPSGPKFGQPTYFRRVHETFPVGTLLVNASAEDTDGVCDKMFLWEKKPTNTVNPFYI